MYLSFVVQQICAGVVRLNAHHDQELPRLVDILKRRGSIVVKTARGLKMSLAVLINQFLRTG